MSTCHNTRTGEEELAYRLDCLKCKVIKRYLPFPHYAKKNQEKASSHRQSRRLVGCEIKATGVRLLDLHYSASNKFAYRLKELLAAVQHLRQPA